MEDSKYPQILSSFTHQKSLFVYFLNLTDLITYSWSDNDGMRGLATCILTLLLPWNLPLKILWIPNLRMKDYTDK